MVKNFLLLDLIGMEIFLKKPWTSYYLVGRCMYNWQNIQKYIMFQLPRSKADAELVTDREDVRSDTYLPRGDLHEAE